MRSSMLLLALAACQPEGADPLISGLADDAWAEDWAGEQAPPPPYQATLQTTSPVAGFPMWLRSYGHPVGANVLFGRGAPGLYCPPSLGGACIDILNPVTLSQDVSSGETDAITSIQIPALAMPGATTTLQAANLAGFGYPTVISQPLPIRIEPTSPCTPGSFSVVPNAHLGLPLAGEFEQTVGASMMRVFDGDFGANVLEVRGNENVRSLLPMMISGMLTEAGLWVWRDPNAGVTPFTWKLYYTDGSFDTETVNLTPTVDGWQFVDMFPSLTPRTTRRLEVWGFGGAMDVTRFGDFTVCATL